MAVELNESPAQMIGDAEKSYAFFARMLAVLGNILDAVQESTFDIDMYGDDPNGVSGKIGALTGAGVAPLLRTYNGPYTIQTILATWNTAAVTSVILQLGDKTMQLVPAQGIFNPQGLKIKMSRDDLVALTVTPAAACHLQINGYAEMRRRDYMYDKPY